MKDLIKEEWSGDHLGQCQNKRVNCDLSQDVVFSSCSSDYGSKGILTENIQGWNRKTPNHKGKYWWPTKIENDAEYVYTEFEFNKLLQKKQQQQLLLLLRLQQ